MSQASSKPGRGASRALAATVVSLASLLGATPGAVAQDPRVIALAVASEPSGARVIAAGRVLGITPIDTQLEVSEEVARDGLRLTVSRDGYQPSDLTVDVSRGLVVVQTALRPLDPPSSAPIGAPPLAPAIAQSPTPLAPDVSRHELRGRVGFYTAEPAREDRLTAATLEIEGRFGLLDGGPGEAFVDLDVALSAAALGVDGGRGAAFRVGNPHAQVRAGARLGEVRVSGGVGLALPLTAAFDDDRDVVAAAAYAAANGMSAWRDPWRWIYSTAAVTAEGRVTYAGEQVQLGGALSIGGILGVDRGRTQQPDWFSFQLRGHIQGQPHPLVTLGGEIGFSHLAMLETDLSNSALSIAPYAHLDFEGGYVGPRFTLNVIDPLGFSFDAGGVWSLALEGGARF
ncbi:MAG: hypothetical protein SangKO_044280 [Sandaracinaceae bacterium]|nr:hypothetical protein [Myxococcales bacterium]